MRQCLIRHLMVAACAAFATHGSAFAQVREVTPQEQVSQPTTLSLSAIVPISGLFWVSELFIIFLVAVPIYRFCSYGWGDRREDFTNRLAGKDLSFYFDRFWKDTLTALSRQNPPNTDEERFKRIYDIIAGKRLYRSPAIILLIATFIFSGLSISTAVRAGYEQYFQYYAHWQQEEHINIAGLTHLSLNQINASVYPFSVVMLSLPVLAAIAGAYLYVMGIVIYGYRTRTLTSSDLWWCSFRLVIAAPLGLAIGELANPTLAAFIGFALGAFPMDAINRILRRMLNAKLNVSEQLDVDYLVRLSGVTADTSAILQGEGVRSAVQLACEDPVSLAIRSGLPFDFVLNLVSQAQIWSYIGETAAKLAPLGLGDARSIYRLIALSGPDTQQAILNTVATKVGMDSQTLWFIFIMIARDPYTVFLSKFS
jgi:hypothetical protein